MQYSIFPPVRFYEFTHDHLPPPITVAAFLSTDTCPYNLRDPISRQRIMPFQYSGLKLAYKMYNRVCKLEGQMLSGPRMIQVHGKVHLNQLFQVLHRRSFDLICDRRP